MKVLKDILPKTLSLYGNDAVELRGLALDSRQVREGYVFIATKGTRVDGHHYIQKAIENGATTIILEDMPENPKDGITYVQVENSRQAAGELAAAYYGHPSRGLELVGVTGTNGKTTTVTLLHRLFSGMGYKAGLLSTIENKIGQTVLPATHTTPDPIHLNALLRDMVDAGCSHAFMEVSSHAADQDRIAGLAFQGAVFTNLSHDHLDYHKNFDHYIRAKKKFFDQLPKAAFALTNLDDRRGSVMVQNTKAKIHTYALRKPADFKAKIMENALTGLQLDLNGIPFHGRLIGEFNAYNYLATYATAILLGMEQMEVLTALSALQTAEGRMDYVSGGDSGIMGIVDYAHTPDALEKVLATIAQLKPGNAQVITVLGCGGDRDKTKRPVMANAACTWSQRVIFTSDNPRSEDPDSIIRDMEAGVKITDKTKTLSITDRAQAIKTACALARKGDIILVAGKGHEKYQERNGVKSPFDDKEILKTFLSSQNPISQIKT